VLIVGVCSHRLRWTVRDFLCASVGVGRALNLPLRRGGSALQEVICWVVDEIVGPTALGCVTLLTVAFKH